MSIYSFAIILKMKRKLVVLPLLSYRCIVTINVLWLFLTVPLVGLQYVIVVLPDHTHLLFARASSQFDTFSYSGSSGILDSDGKRNTA